MGDLISREALIESVKTWDMQDLYLPTHFIDLIEAEPSVTDTNVGGKWIPCSERLPEENRDGWTELVLSIKTGEVILGFWHDIETGFCRRFRDGVCSAGGVIAWQPLPEPYKGEQHETD